MNRCPGKVEFARAISEALCTPSSATIPSHLSTCDRCRTEWHETVRAIRLAREMPVPAPDPARMSHMRSALAGAKEHTPEFRRRAIWRIAVIAIAAAAGILLFGGAVFIFAPALHPVSADAASPQPFRGTVTAASSARYAHVIQKENDVYNEIVQLFSGAISIGVVPLGPNERFRVETEDAVVEVRGTRFTVVAERGHLERVTVEKGRVMVRANSGGNVLLTAGGKWHRKTLLPHAGAHARNTVQEIGRRSTATVDTEASNEKSASRKHESAPVRTSVTPGAQNGRSRFEEGWLLLRQKKYAEAAKVFDEVVTSEEPAHNGEEIYFWRAMAHYRKGTPHGTLSAIEDFLQRYPHSLRTDEARMIYGWYWYNAGEYQKAQTEFEALQNSSIRQVRQNARTGLRGIELKKQH